jgi:methylenetetrahydrofolate dehydrogenase (NADP+)/methenyltetrahydrofolate cyclohydrolase
MAAPKILDGKALSKELEAELKNRVDNIKSKNGGITPVLATILVGADPASATYVKMKGNACNRVGMEPLKVEMSEDTTTDELLAQIEKLNSDERVHGILLQHPVPSQIDERLAFDAISIKKDVDGVTCLGFGRMAMGEAAYGSATPAGIMKIIDHYGVEVEGKHAVIIGRSPILGKPAALMMLNKNATVTICHSRTQNLGKFVKEADIVIGAVGRPKFIKSEWIKEGAVVIDAGYHPVEKCGDIDLDGCIDKCSSYTPVPGGVGPMTIGTLIAQTVEAAEEFYL